jgi:hypothetical protein
VGRRPNPPHLRTHLPQTPPTTPGEPLLQRGRLSTRPNDRSVDINLTADDVTALLAETANVQGPAAQELRRILTAVVTRLPA